MQHALMVAGLAAAFTFIQAAPGYLAETEGTTPGDWADAQVARWWGEAEAYLSEYPDGVHREDTYRLMLDLAWFRDEKLAREPLDVARRYLAEFPDGVYRDEMEWKQFLFEHHVWEYGERLPLVLEHAAAFDDYLASHHDSAVVDEIKLAVGWRYQIAYELITHGPDPDTGFSAEDAAAFRSRAVALWREVLDSGDGDAVERARYFLEDEWVYYAFPPQHRPEPEPQRVTFVVGVGDDGGYSWQQQNPGITLPEVVTQNNGYVLWRSASAAASTIGDPPEGAPPAGSGECEIAVGFSDRWNDARVEPPNTVADMIEWAEAAFEGVVVGSSGGFLNGLAGRMLEVRVTRALKTSSLYAGETLYVYYPAGEVVVGDRRFCRSSNWLPAPPEVGDRILVLPRHPPVDPDYPIVELMTTGIEVTFGSGTTTRLPTQLLAVEELSGAKRFNHVVRAIRKAAKALRDRR